MRFILPTVLLAFSSFFSASVFADAILKKAPDSLEKAKASYSMNCATCHGEKGDGNGPAGAALNPKPRDFTKGEFKQGGTPQKVYDTITNGFKTNAMMIAFKHLSPEERSSLAYYVLSFKTAPAKKK